MDNNVSKCPDCGIAINTDSNEGTSGCILCFDEGRYARSIHDDGRPHPRDPKEAAMEKWDDIYRDGDESFADFEGD